MPESFVLHGTCLYWFYTDAVVNGLAGVKMKVCFLDEKMC